MSFTAIRNAVLLCATMAISGVALGAAPARTQVVIEPLLGLRWSPARVRFTPAPADLLRRCPTLVNENYDRRLWVLARAALPDGELIVVSGSLVPRRADLPGGPGDAGASVRLGPAGCTLVAPAREAFDDPADAGPGVTDADLAALKADAAARYVTAWGGPVKLCAAMRQQGRRLTGLPPALRPAFKAKAACLR